MDPERFSDSSIDQDPQTSLEELNEALRGDPDNAEWLCQRAYAHLLLKNYSCAVDDAQKAQQLEPGRTLPFMRTGIAEYHMSNYESSHAAFVQGQQLDVSGTNGGAVARPEAEDEHRQASDQDFDMWIQRCEEMIKESQNHSVDRTAAAPPVKHDWYQTESQVIITIMVKNAPKDGVLISFSEKQLSARIVLPSGEDFSLNFHLLHPISPQHSTFKILSTKVEIKLKKTDAVRWEKLEGEGDESNVKHFTPNQYPSSSHVTRNWDQVVVDIAEEEKKEKLEGDAALNKLFQQIYTDGSDEVKRAMNKSFMESGGTVLSTNWKDVV